MPPPTPHHTTPALEPLKAAQCGWTRVVGAETAKTGRWCSDRPWGCVCGNYATCPFRMLAAVSREQRPPSVCRAWAQRKPQIIKWALSVGYLSPPWEVLSPMCLGSATASRSQGLLSICTPSGRCRAPARNQLQEPELLIQTVYEGEARQEEKLERRCDRKALSSTRNDPKGLFHSSSSFYTSSR